MSARDAAIAWLAKDDKAPEPGTDRVLDMAECLDEARTILEDWIEETTPPRRPKGGAS